MHQLLKITKKRTYSDAELVDGLRAHDGKVEGWFYAQAKTYFMAHFRDVFFDEDRRQEIFQDTVLRLWTEIEDGRIRMGADGLERLQPSGEYRMMTASLWTFLMAIARNTYREVVRNCKEASYEDLFGGVPVRLPDSDDEAEALQEQIRIVDACIEEMPPRCVEILTLFYYEGKSLDEIMLLRGGKNESKVGLKTAKYKCMNILRQRVTERMKSA